MSKITINNKEYELELLNEDARQQLANVQLADQEIQRLQMQLAIVQTARNAYANALNMALPNQSDTIKFN
jgi:Family of unknown function (DUF6447)